jgi:copper transport protein
MKRPRALVALAGVAAVSVTVAAAKDTTRLWAQAPPSARARVNPYAGSADAVQAGRKLVARHCAECHGPDGHGGRNAPPLATDEVRAAGAGELFWVLTNGHLGAGMPSWSRLPEARRWQIVSFLKSPDAGSGR